MSHEAAGFASNIARFSGFADQYNKFRPQPPAEIGSLLLRYAHTPRPDLVVDLGCGTGLSTRYWAGKAAMVIGIDPTADMLNQARAMTTTANISYREGFSHQTGLPDHCADIVTCSQSLHWMEPQATFVESARLLRPGGVFAAFDYDWPPATGDWQAEQAFEECIKQVAEVDKGFPIETPLKQWKKAEHLARMEASQCFCYCREVKLHSVELGNAERFIGLLYSQGHVMTLLKMGVSEEKLGIDRFKAVVTKALGDDPQPWYWGSHLRFGIVA